MSAEIVQPLLGLLHEPFVSQKRPLDTTSYSKLKVKRALFGPVDHAETQAFLNQALEVQYQTQSEKWNFDFKRDRPLDPEGTFIWKPATPVKLLRPVKQRPEEEYDTGHLYCKPQVIHRPVPVKLSLKEQKHTAKCKTNVMQSQITDFMAIKKKSSVDLIKKLEHSGPLVKKPRISELAS